MPETTITAIDGTDALAFVIVRPGKQEGGVEIEAAAKGLSKQDAAHVLRHVADTWAPQDDAPLKPDVKYHEIKTEVDVTFPASGASDLDDPWNGRTVIPETIRISLIRTQTPDETREWAHVTVSGPHRLRSGDRGQEIDSNGWEDAHPSAKGHTFVDRPDWLTQEIADHLPEGWNPSLLGLTGGAR